jgi:hypothetical protein
MPDTAGKSLMRLRAHGNITGHHDGALAADKPRSHQQCAGRRPRAHRIEILGCLWFDLPLAVLITLACAVRAGAQVPQPVAVPAPPQPEFFSGYDFHLAAAGLLHEDDPAQRFSWDTHFGGSADLVDYVAGRASITADYQAVLGSEYRAFDPNQGNYILEAAASGRAGRTEIVGVFHHVSRHLSDRPKRAAIAWNTFGGRVLHRLTVGGTTLDFDFDLGWVTQRALVDYSWIGSANVQIRHDITPHVGVFAHGAGQLYGVDELVAGRSSQRGGLAEGGIRFRGGAGVLELFAGIERRVDAFPLDRTPEQWGLAGFRLLSR